MLLTKIIWRKKRCEKINLSSVIWKESWFVHITEIIYNLEKQAYNKDFHFVFTKLLCNAFKMSYVFPPALLLMETFVGCSQKCHSWQV